MKALLRQRSKIEGKIDHPQDLGMRQARYRGRRRTRPAGAARSLVANFKRLGVLGAFKAPTVIAIAA